MKRAVILLGPDYQDLEVWYPLLRLREAGWKVVTAGTTGQANYTGKLGYPIQVDCQVEQVAKESFDAIVIPGGWAPDYIRRNAVALDLVTRLNSERKIVAAICHAGWVLCSTPVLKGRRVTSFSAIRDDMKNAGAIWEDAEVVVDGNLVTSRKPDDLPAFCQAILRVATEC